MRVCLDLDEEEAKALRLAVAEIVRFGETRFSVPDREIFKRIAKKFEEVGLY